MNYVSLHNHLVYSTLDGLNQPNKFVEAVKATGATSVAMTDHGNLAGVPAFFSACQKAGIKSIIGLEAYMVPNINDKKKFKTKSGRNSMAGYHITLLAKNLTGYHNLVRLNNIAHIDGFYFRPKIDWDILMRHREGLIVLSGCVGSELADYALANQLTGAEILGRKFKEVFGDDYFVEITDNNMQADLQRLANAGQIETAKRIGALVVPTNDTHYLRAEHKAFHDLMIQFSRAQEKRASKDGKKAKKQEGYDGVYHLKSYDEMIRVFGDCVRNTQVVADRIESFDVFDKRVKLPNPLSDAHKILVMVAKAGLVKRGLSGKPEHSARLEKELGIVERLGFSNYFLTTRELIEIFREANCPTGWGRGSGGSSMICYCLELTDVDPLKYNLLFERFISEDRPDWPDIDLDIPMSRRNEIIERIVKKFGQNKVAHISTVLAFRPKILIRDICREYGINSETADRWSSLVPPIYESYEESIQGSPIEEELAKTTQGRFILQAFQDIVGSHRHIGTHASGIVIANESIVDHLPIRTEQVNNKPRLVTQYTMEWLDKFGFFKFDVLGLKTLDVIYATAAEVGLDVKQMPLDDPKALELIGSSKVEGMFQLDKSKTCAELCRQVKPENIMEVATILALHRPGVMNSDQYELYLRRRKGTEEVQFAHSDLKEILLDNYGICIFQEDLMRMATILAGYTPAEAYNLMKGVGKKDMEIVRKHITMFVERARKIGKINEAKIQQVIQQIEASGRYAFNRSHAVEYAHVTCACAYLSAYHPIHFFGKQVSFADNDEEKSKYLSAAIARGIEILPPDVNQSDAYITVESGGLRLGLLSMKGVGAITAQEIIANRPYDDIKKVLNVVNRSVYAALYAVGALKDVPGVEARPPATKLDETDILGISLKSMMNDYKDVVESMSAIPHYDVEAEPVSMVVKVADIKPWKDKHKRAMGFLSLIDVYGSKVDSVMFWEAFKNFPPKKGKVYHAIVARTGSGSIQIQSLIDVEKLRKIHAAEGVDSK